MRVCQGGKKKSGDSRDINGSLPDTRPVAPEKRHFSDGLRHSGAGPEYERVPHSAAGATSAPTPSPAP